MVERIRQSDEEQKTMLGGVLNWEVKLVKPGVEEEVVMKRTFPGGRFICEGDEKGPIRGVYRSGLRLTLPKKIDEGTQIRIDVRFISPHK